MSCCSMKVIDPIFVPYSLHVCIEKSAGHLTPLCPWSIVALLSMSRNVVPS